MSWISMMVNRQRLIRCPFISMPVRKFPFRASRIACGAGGRDEEHLSLLRLAQGPKDSSVVPTWGCPTPLLVQKLAGCSRKESAADTLIHSSCLYVTEEGEVDWYIYIHISSCLYTYIYIYIYIYIQIPATPRLICKHLFHFYFKLSDPERNNVFVRGFGFRVDRVPTCWTTPISGVG